MVEPFVKMKKLFIGLLGAAVLLAGCTAAAPTEVETESPETEQEPFLSGQSREEIEIQDSSQGEDIGEISMAGAEDEKWIFQSPYASAYFDFMQNYIAACTPIEKELLRFCLAFIDADDIPELLLMPTEGHVDGVEVYTYVQEQVTRLGEFGSYGEMQYVERQGLIFGYDSGMDNFYSDFYKLADGVAELTCSLHSWLVYSQEEQCYENEFYEIDGVSVTESVFQTKWQELYDNGKYVSIGYEDGCPLRDVELLPTLAQAIEKLMWKRDSRLVLEQVSRQTEVLAAYETILDDLARKWSDTVRFTLIYLDNDDIPELVVLGDTMPHDSVDVFTYDQGKTVLVGNYESEGFSTYWEKEGIIFNRYAGGERGVYSVHKVTGAEDTLLQTFGWWWEYPNFYDGDEDGQRVFTVDDKEVPEAQYNEALQKWDNTNEKKLDAYDTSTPIKDVDIGQVLREELQTLILTRYDALRENVLIKSGLDEDAILFMDYDDYDGDGIYEAFVFCGESYDYYGEINYSGDFWFVGADQCMRLPERFGSGSDYRKIDGLMMLGHEQKYLYYYSDYCVTANISGIWTVESGKPVEANLPQTGQVVYRGEPYGFELWVDSYNHYYEPGGDLWTGHTWRPYFYHYDSQAGQLMPDEGENLSPKELEGICGFDLAGEVEAEGYEVTAMVRWQPSDIVTINYTIPLNEDDALPEITYENIIWDCKARDYWRSKERGVNSWQNAGEGGSI